MQMGMVGLGRMGASVVRRLMRGGHECVVYDVNADAVAPVAHEGALGVSSLDALAAALKKPRVVWMMVPAAVVEQTVGDLSHRFEQGDIIVDGGIVWGLERGFCQMIGGESDIVQHLDPLFATLAPAIDSAPRTPGHDRKSGGTAEHGYPHCGRTAPVGGHLEKGRSAGSARKREAS